MCISWSDKIDFPIYFILLAHCCTLAFIKQITQKGKNFLSYLKVLHYKVLQDACHFYIQWQTSGNFYENDTILLFPWLIKSNKNPLQCDSNVLDQADGSGWVVLLYLGMGGKDRGSAMITPVLVIFTPIGSLFHTSTQSNWPSLSAEKIGLSLSHLVPDTLGPKVGLILNQNVFLPDFKHFVSILP